MHLRDRPMTDADNYRLQNELGWHDVPFVRDSWGIRRLSVAEVARLQGFDSAESLFPDMPSPEKYRLLGNAVCVHLAQLVGRACADILDGEVV